MSWSRFRLGLAFDMLDGRVECNPEMADWSGGHTSFNTSVKIGRYCGPASWMIDGSDKSEEPWDRQAWVDSLVDRLKQDIVFEIQRNGDKMLRYMVENLLKQAEKHCEEHHKDGTFGHKGH